MAEEPACYLYPARGSPIIGGSLDFVRVATDPSNCARDGDDCGKVRRPRFALAVWLDGDLCADWEGTVIVVPSSP